MELKNKIKGCHTKKSYKPKKIVPTQVLEMEQPIVMRRMLTTK